MVGEGRSTLRLGTRACDPAIDPGVDPSSPNPFVSLKPTSTVRRLLFFVRNFSYNIAMLQNVILLMGPPGCGKGTQSKLLVDKLGYGYFSMGDTLRAYAKMDSDLGRQIKTTIDQGYIVPDDVAEQVFRESFIKIAENAKGLIVDGYPRTDQQIRVFEEVLTSLGANDKIKVIFLDVDKQKLIDRLKLRSQTEGRDDDADMAAIEKRFDEYNKKTAFAKQYYDNIGLVTHINGDQSIEVIHQEILTKLGLA